MSKPLLRPGAAVVLVCAAIASASPAPAVPVHPVVVSRAPAVSPRTARGVSIIVRSAAAPFRYQVRSAEAEPIKALPLIAPREPVRFVPVVLPRLGLATLLAPLGPDACAARRSPVVLAALPVNPFSTISCLDGATPAASGGGGAASSLTPGHNKNALYGRAYAPGFADWGAP